MTYQHKPSIRFSARSLLVAVSLLATTVFAPPGASAAITVTPSTWNIIGLDSNSPAFGPYRFPVGAKVCSTTAATDVPVTFNWDTGGTDNGTYIYLRPGSNSSITVDIPAGGCTDALFEVEVNRSDLAYNQTRRFHITAGGVSTPTPRELKVERLVSQGRNAITDMQFGTSPDALTSVPNGGSMDLIVGDTYYIKMVGFTATQGYEQLESFVNFPNTIFQVLSVNSTYSADTSALVPNPNPNLYANGCGWEDDPYSPNYLSCLTDGKAGGNVEVTYQVKILSTGSGRESLSSLIHDFSGSSFHYNSDYSTTARFANLIDPTAVTIAKNFAPDPTNAGGVSTLTFTLTNPNYGTVSRVNFIDNLPTLPTDMLVANPPNATTSGCGTPTFSPAAGATTLSFSNGTITANSTCTIKVNVTPPATGTYSNTTGHLFIDSIDTGNFATDTITVNNAPPPPTPICGLPLASWTVPAGSANPPVAIRASDVVTATISALFPARTGIAGNGQGDTASWSTYGYKTTGQYLDFIVDTSKYASVSMSFYLANPSPANGPTQMVVSYSTGGAFTNFYTVNNPAKAFTQHVIDFSGLTSTTGNTTFRITASGANTDSSGGSLDFDNIVFTGCGLPYPPTISKSFATNPVAVGGTSALTFTVTNPNVGFALSNISFTDTLPSGLTVATTGPTAVCGGTLNTIAPSTISFSGGTLAVGTSCNAISTTVTATTSGPHDNVSGYVSGQYSGNTYTNTGMSGIATASLTALAPPVIAKKFSPNPIFTNGSTTLTFTLTNPNPSDPLSGVAFTDTFPIAPGAMTVATPLTIANTCGGTLQDNSGGALAAGDPGVRLTGGALAAGGSCTVSVNVTAAAAGTYTNTSSNVSHTLNGTWNGNAASDTLLLETPNVDISLIKLVGPSSTGPWSSYLAVATGTDVYYKFTVENLGDVALNPVTVTDPAPYLNLASCIWRDGDGNLRAPLTLPVADADNGHLATCVLGPVTAVAGSHLNTATVTGTFSGTTDTDTSSASYATTGLTVTKSATQSHFFAEGDVLDYLFAVTNTGAATLGGPVTIADDRAIDENCPPLNTVGDLDNFLDAGETITCTASYTVTAADVAAKAITNKATATTGGVTTTEVSLTVPLGPDLSASKSNDVVGILIPGQSFNWTFIVTNAATAGASAIFTDTQVLIRDDLPAAGATYAAPAIATNSAGTTGTIACTITDHVLTCAASGGSVSIPPGESFSIAVTVTTTSGGSLVNPKSGGICRADPGTLITEIDDANNDCANTVMVGIPSLTILKSVQPDWDPINGTTSPKAIPGAFVTYTILVTNSGFGPTDAGSVTIADRVPANLELFVGDIGAPGSGPVLFTDGATASGLNYVFGGLGDTTDKLAFSTDGTDYTYAPTPDGNGCDQAVTHFMVSFDNDLTPPLDIFAGSDGTNHPSFSLSFRGRIK